MSSLHIASSLQPWIWSCCTYIVGFCHLLDAFFDFYITMLYVLSYLIIRPYCPNRCLRVIICAIGTILFYDIELEVSFGESIYFYYFTWKTCAIPHHHIHLHLVHIYLFARNSWHVIHVSNSDSYISPQMCRVFAYLNWYLSWYFVSQFYNLLLEVPCMSPVNPVQKYIVALHYL
jgi:hypothetical protein